MSGIRPGPASGFKRLGGWVDVQRSHQTGLRAIFWLYAAALFTATHWPALELHVAMVERPDLFVHFGCFGSWFFLFWLTAYAGPPVRPRCVGISAVVAAAYAGLDEGLQAIPWVRRTCALDDYLANCGGIALAAVLAMLLVLAARRGAR